mmetsp:Transcript_33673/g.112408  ORF Transcript_33673/g.112408 Transcript_33673/m.112408 type:complete len:262 (+) Transcript_33673:852-1637(+)
MEALVAAVQGALGAVILRHHHLQIPPNRRRCPSRTARAHDSRRSERGRQRSGTVAARYPSPVEGGVGNRVVLSEEVEPRWILLLRRQACKRVHLKEDVAKVEHEDATLRCVVAEPGPVDLEPDEGALAWRARVLCGSPIQPVRHAEVVRPGPLVRWSASALPSDAGPLRRVTHRATVAVQEISHPTRQLRIRHEHHILFVAALPERAHENEEVGCSHLDSHGKHRVTGRHVAAGGGCPRRLPVARDRRGGHALLLSPSLSR